MKTIDPCYASGPAPPLNEKKICRNATGDFVYKKLRFYEVLSHYKKNIVFVGEYLSAVNKHVV
jgi:hypothetical protein